MSRLLEILGSGMSIDIADLILHWFGVIRNTEEDGSDSESQSNGSGNQQLDQVIDLLCNNKTESATEKLRLYLFDNPSCMHGRMAAAVVCLQNGELEQAIEELTKVYETAPNNTMALYALGHCYERLGKESEAIEFYQDCIKFKNFLQLPHQRLAAIYFKNSQLEKAVSQYEQLKLEYPDDMSTLVTLGYLYIACQNYDSAIEVFDTAILVHPDNFHEVPEEVEQLVAEGHFYEALENLDKLIEENPQRADILTIKADVLGKMGDFENSVKQYEQAIDMYPDLLEATIKLGTQYLRSGGAQLAAQQFNKATEINDQIVDAYIGLVIAYKLRGNAAEAASTLSLAAAIGPNSTILFAHTAALQFNIARGVEVALEDMSNSNEIVKAIISIHREQIRNCPQNPDLLYRAAVLMMSLNQMQQAAITLTEALKINPLNARARNKLAICMFETGENDLGITELTKSPPLDKNTLDLHYKTALLYCDPIKFASSLINLEQNMQENFACTEPTANVSLVLQNLGLLDRASAMWDSLAGTTGYGYTGA
ncbi:tetratricopeptide repeat protein [Planctomycetota bacterium]